MARFDHAASFGGGALAYAAARPNYPDALYDWIVAACPGRALAVDVAAGAGQGTRGLLARFARVVALDQSAELLAQIPPHPALELQVSAAEELRADDADLVVVHQALHWFAGPAFYSRVAAALRPGGLFVVVGYAWFEVDAEVDRVVAEMLLPALAPHWSERNRLVMDGYRAVELPWRERLAPAFAIEVDWTREALWAYVQTWSAAAALRAAQGDGVLDAPAAALRVAWPDATARRVRMPLSVRAWQP
jgi:SAM-dependent methyltransferase